MNILCLLSPSAYSSVYLSWLFSIDLSKILSAPSDVIARADPKFTQSAFQQQYSSLSIHVRVKLSEFLHLKLCLIRWTQQQCNHSKTRMLTSAKFHHMKPHSLLLHFHYHPLHFVFQWQLLQLSKTLSCGPISQEVVAC